MYCTTEMELPGCRNVDGNSERQRRMTFHLQLPRFVPRIWKANPSQPTFLWFLPWQGASWFDRQEPSHLSILISIKKFYFWLFAFLIHSLKKIKKKKTHQKTCGFIGAKKDKDFNKQTSEVQLPSTSVNHLPNTKPCTCSYCNFHLHPLQGNCDNWGEIQNGWEI